MNKAFYIVGIVFSIIFLFMGAYYAEEVSSAKWSSIFNSYSSYSDYGYSYGSLFEDDYKDITVTAGLWSLFFFASFITIDLMGLLKVKTKTTKIFSIIGLSLSGIFLLWNFGVLSSPGSMSFDEVYPGWAFYCLVMLAFGIVGLVQSVRYSKAQNNVGMSPANTTDKGDLLDS